MSKFLLTLIALRFYSDLTLGTATTFWACLYCSKQKANAPPTISRKQANGCALEATSITFRATRTLAPSMHLMAKRAKAFLF